MTNFENDIMDLLQGDTPKQKYEYLKDLISGYAKPISTLCDCSPAPKFRWQSEINSNTCWACGNKINEKNR